MQKINGFTLTELIVALAVISMLAGLLLPAVGRARETDHSTVCINNLRQLGSVMAAYAGDFDEWFFHWYYEIGDPDDGSTWEEKRWYYKLNEYDDKMTISAGGPLHCPAVATHRHDRAGYGPLYRGVLNYRYGTGRGEVPNAPARSYGRGFLPARISQVTLPERSVLFGDVNGTYFLKNTSRYRSSGDFATRHDGGANVLFVGGNVSTHPATKFPHSEDTKGLKNHDLNVWLRNSARSISGPFPYQGVLDFQ